MLAMTDLRDLASLPSDSYRTTLEVLSHASQWSGIGPQKHLGVVTDTFYVVDALADAVQLGKDTAELASALKERNVSLMPQLRKASITAGDLTSDVADSLNLATRLGTVNLGPQLETVKLAGNITGIYSKSLVVYDKLQERAEIDASADEANIKELKKTKNWWDIAFFTSIIVIKVFSIIGAVAAIAFSSTFFLTLSTAIVACDVMNHLAKKEVDRAEAQLQFA